MLAGVHAAPIGAGQAAVDAYARSLLARAGDEAPEHFYVFDLGAVLERWRVWTTALPRVVPHYAGARSVVCRGVSRRAHTSYFPHASHTFSHPSQMQPRQGDAGAAGGAGHGVRLRVARRD